VDRVWISIGVIRCIVLRSNNTDKWLCKVCFKDFGCCFVNIYSFAETGGLFGLAVSLMQLFSSNRENYRPIIDLLGLLFQIRFAHYLYLQTIFFSDDYANLCSREYTEKKSYAEDLTEGKFSFPIVYAIHTHPDDTELISMLLFYHL
jgi:geranylgeranyl pyrophosphate synthase